MCPGTATVAEEGIKEPWKPANEPTSKAGAPTSVQCNGFKLDWFYVDD